MDNVDAYAALVAAIVRVAVQDACNAARAQKHASVIARSRLAADADTALWAECLGIAWPPDIRILAEIIDALDAGERIWYER